MEGSIFAENEMTFSLAIGALKCGYKVARKGWNGKGMWLVLVPGTPIIYPTPDTPYGKAGITECEVLPHIDMWTTNADGRRAMSLSLMDSALG